MRVVGWVPQCWPPSQGWVPSPSSILPWEKGTWGKEGVALWSGEAGCRPTLSRVPLNEWCGHCKYSGVAPASLLACQLQSFFTAAWHRHLEILPVSKLPLAHISGTKARGVSPQQLSKAALLPSNKNSCKFQGPSLMTCSPQPLILSGFKEFCGQICFFLQKSLHVCMSELQW